MTYDVSALSNSVRYVKNAARDDGGVQPRLAEKSTLDGTSRATRPAQTRHMDAIEPVLKKFGTAGPARPRISTPCSRFSRFFV
jgi:hypothetical protein